MIGSPRLDPQADHAAGLVVLLAEGFNEVVFADSLYRLLPPCGA
ncbi:hypothetical protein ACFRFL_43175 [Streptomyces sp. NPDC056708]